MPYCKLLAIIGGVVPQSRDPQRVLSFFSYSLRGFPATVADILMLSVEGRNHLGEWNDVPGRTTGEWQEQMAVR
eukprot:7649805-Karenia_brevis.AAC.1